jgi:hypothetical protein
MAPELLVDAPEQEAAQRHGQATRDGAQALERAPPTALVDLAFDGRPEQVEHLRDDDHARDSMVP